MKRAAWWIVAAVVVVAVIAVGWWGYRQAKDFEALARAGKADASAALKSLEGGDTAAALAGFDKARDEFTRARDLLGPSWLRGTWWLGDQLDAADDLATIGVEGSTAGAEGVRLLDEASAVTGPDRLGRLLTLARPRLDASLTSLTVVAGRYDRLSADGLVGPLAEAVTDARDRLAPLRPLLARSDALLGLERYLYAGDHRFLVVAQNSSELRPTGGFMGTFGLIRVGPRGLELESFADVYTLPRDTLDEPLPEGGQVTYHHFYFRNSNWWMDFPTSAQMMHKFWANMRQPSIDGVVAVDIPFLQALLRVHGPITVPEERRPITAENAMLLLNEVVQYERSGQASRSERKLAIISLVDALFDWMTRLPADRTLPLAEALAAAGQQKHVQAYFTDPTAQAAMTSIGWSGALAPPEGTTDLVAVSNGVIKPSKANFGVSKTLDYVVTLNTEGSADTTLRLGFVKSAKKLLGVPQQWLANYTRVHRLAGTTSAGKLEDGFARLIDATGLPTFGRYFRLDPGESTSIALRSHVPHAVQQGVAPTVPGEPGTASPATGEVSHYRLLLAKQADLTDMQAAVSVQVPKGWTVVASTAWLRNSGEVLPTTVAGDRVTLATPLSQDVLLDVTLRRP